ncbi:unnamed protein product, partial [Trichogramma brassicae]
CAKSRSTGCAPNSKYGRRAASLHAHLIHKNCDSVFSIFTCYFLKFTHLSHFPTDPPGGAWSHVIYARQYSARRSANSRHIARCSPRLNASTLLTEHAQREISLERAPTWNRCSSEIDSCGNSVNSTSILRGQFIDSARKNHRFHVDFCQFIHEDFLGRSTRMFWSLNNEKKFLR